MSRRFQLLCWALGCHGRAHGGQHRARKSAPTKRSRTIDASTQRGAVSADFRARIRVDHASWRRGSNLSVRGGSFGFGSALRGSAPVGNGPSLLAVDPATHTIYVANGNNDNGPNAGGDTVSVIDSRRCNAKDVSRCKGPWPTITVGNRMNNDLASGVAVDEKTDTVYVTNGRRHGLGIQRRNVQRNRHLGLSADARKGTRRARADRRLRRPGQPHRVRPGLQYSDRHQDRLDDRQHDVQRNRPGGLSDHAGPTVDVEGRPTM